MTTFETLTITTSQQSQCEDRVAALHEDHRCVIVAADGAGGTGGGVAAAETVIREIRASFSATSTGETWRQILSQTDYRMGAGESTAVVVDISENAMVGASVGDSCAWHVRDGQIDELTRHQRRKPLLGSGSAEPVVFQGGPLDGILIVATDGFCNYVNRSKLLELLTRAAFDELPRKLVDLVRLKSGELWDDVGIVVCRRRPPIRRTRKRYEIDSEAR